MERFNFQIIEMVEDRREFRLYEAEPLDEGGAQARRSFCPCCESANRARMRRRCRSEGLERSPYDASSRPEAWPSDRHAKHEHSYSADARRSDYYGKSYVKFPHPKDNCDRDGYACQRRVPDPPVQYKQNGDCSGFQSRPGGRLSPYGGYVFKSHYASRVDDEASLWRESRGSYAGKLIENEEPHLFTVDEYQEKYMNGDADRPKSEGRKTPLKSILINSSRRSVSPNFFRKSKGKPPPDRPEAGDKYVEGRRRVRAQSESDKNSRLLDNV